MFRTLKEQGGFDVDFLTTSKMKEVMLYNPYITNTFYFDKLNQNTFNHIKNNNYVYVIDLQNNIKSRRLTFQLGKPTHRVNKLNVKKWLLVNFKRDTMPDIHIVDRYLQTVKHLGIQNDNQGLDVFLPNDSAAQWQKIQTLAGVESFDLAIAIGAAHQTKQITDETLIEVCKNVPGKIALLGGPNDIKKAERIERVLDDNKIINLVGRLTLTQSSIVLQNSKATLTGDTGLMHIAAGLKKPIISVWGNTVPQFGMYPYYPEGKSTYSVHQVNNLSCRPCSKIGHTVCPKRHFKCMKDQDSNEIVENILHFIE